MRDRTENSILGAVEKTIDKYRMLHAGHSILACVSGGPDSVALLHVLNTLSGKLKLRLAVAHVNHCLRGIDSDGDAAFVALLAERLGLPLYHHRADVEGYRRDHGLSIEAAARRVRYEFFRHVAEEKGFDRIATGHHSDDNAEQILMDIFRGSGHRGLSGIPPVRDGIIVRPLISLTRDDIDGYLTAKGIEARFDKSNLETRYLRNRIRHELLPDLKSSYNPGISKTLNRLAEIVGTEEQWIETLVDAVFDRIATRSRDSDRLYLSISGLKRRHTALQRRLVRKGIACIKGELKRITFTHVGLILALLEKKPSYRRLDLPDRIRVTQTDEFLVFSREAQPLRRTEGIRKAQAGSKIPRYGYQMSGPGKLYIPEIKGHISLCLTRAANIPNPFPSGQWTAFLDMDTVGFPLTVRSVLPGDRFAPMGMAGRQKVNRFLASRKIPVRERSRHPLVVDCSGRIVWVAGLRIHDRCRIQPSTQTVLMGELLLA